MGARVRGELERARAALGREGSPAAERVHEARKALKRARALFGLLPPGGAAREGARAVRDAGRALGVARDAAALVEAVDRLREARPLHLAEFEPVAAALAERAARHADPGEGAEAPALAAIARALAATERAGSGTEQALLAGLRSGYAGGRRALRALRARPSAEAFHALRKRTKAHSVHLGLLAAAWPVVLDAHVATLTELASALGDEHDLGLLLVVLPALPGGERCRALALGRRDERRAEAISLALRGFAEGPRGFAARVEALAAAARAAPPAADAWARVARRAARGAGNAAQG